ncbi:MAG TPA: acetyl-CoA acetyltransferase, partial [Thermoanaerobaculia bacterium]|nr:acetyl-CoA acetyltransferase [Thermoanaerobaculia bacterium]
DVERGCPPHPMDLAGEAARRAVEDAGASGDLAAAIDTLAVMRLFGDSSPRRAPEHGRSNNPPRSVARRIGADPANAIYVEVGGNSPQKWVNLMAERIADGSAEVVLLAGAEAIATLKRAARAGVKLEWNEDAPGTLEDRGLGPSLLNPYEIAHGITFPTQVYPLFEQAIRHRRATPLDDHLESMGRLFAPFTEVAAGNPYAYFPKARSPRELATPEGENPFIALPYGRLMNARDGVDQGAAVLLTSVGRARSLGIQPERWVFLHGCADASEPLMSEREDYTRCPAIRVMAERAFEMAGMGLDDVSAIDLYSCFPSAVEVACAELGLRENDPRGLTVTGGLPFFGGPGNNYSMHGIAEMVGRLRGKRDEVGLVTANGGYLSKHSMGLYSAQPVEGDWRREDPASYQAALTARPKPAVVEEANGNATIETYTVVFDDQAAPRLGIVVGRLDDGRRFLANIPPDDRTLLGSLVREDGVGTRGRVARENGTNVFRM